MSTWTDQQTSSTSSDRTDSGPEHERERAPRLQDKPVDVKLVLAFLWITLLLVFAYVDIFAFLRADVLRAALDGKTVNPEFRVGQGFLIATLAYVLVPVLMVVASLMLKARASRAANITVSLVYLMSVVVSCIGETWAYYIVGSVVEVLLLAAIATTAWRWPRTVAPRVPSGGSGSPLPTCRQIGRP